MTMRRRIQQFLCSRGLHRFRHRTFILETDIWRNSTCRWCPHIESRYL